MKFITKIVVSVLTLMTVGGVLLAAPLAQAQSLSGVPVVADAKSDVCSGLAATGGDCSGSSDNGINNLIKLAINALSLIAGIAAVIMIIVGGIKYITSQGDSSNTASAKNTIIYALIGLVIVAMAQLIVKFTLNSATKASTCKAGQTLVNGVCQ